VFTELKSHLRHFLDDELFDRTGFVRLVELLHGLALDERRVAYEYLLHETVTQAGSDESARARALGRIADLVGREPPEIVAHVQPLLQAAA
jgi:hypothetical protein